MTDRVTLYTRAGCHLCASARAVVIDVCAETATPWREVDIDHDPALVAQYGDEVPVVTVDGIVVGFWHIDADAVSAALGENGGQ